ncbi:precorrin-6A reductase [Rhodovulum imhoffii]|uniref:Precorrin-6A reductase n=1 Tax=Rhodovulum imhoffii TaxID=365340 RepID=A0A2T5BRD3_9RHOB|nr:cobalt-precorrin-6A reductase [Rhodovulum imhoffii]MBK5934468.1 cobalt-precorrin-6A reductase [Rhodovulum imhoffii]PTN01816.1 precorrin-6A reductase [Rhodovulum imhoffii]
MQPNLLILGGTTEATALAHEVAARGVPATLSFAGRVERPKPQPIPVRVGGFGGVDGLATYLLRHRITHLIDATHPFAARISRNAVAACAQAGVPMAALSRPAWDETATDRWQHVPDIPAAVTALAGTARRVFLALGRMHLAAFATRPQHFYLLRLVDTPASPPPLPEHVVIVSRGPFTVGDDTALMRRYGIDLIVSKNAGGSGARAKIEAARALSLPVLMIDRPALPERTELHSPAQVFTWLAHSGANLGV